MPLFRKRETYNEQMLREAGFAVPTLAPPKSMLAINGLPDGSGVGPSDWDAVRLVRLPGVAGNRIVFVTLPEGDLIVEEEDGGGDLSPLADAIEEEIAPPYRAFATRQDGELWGVGAKSIDVLRFPFAGADTAEVSRKDSWEEFRVDGEPSAAAVPSPLREAGERVGADFYAKAERMDGDHWEVRVSPL